MTIEEREKQLDNMSQDAGFFNHDFYHKCRDIIRLWEPDSMEYDKDHRLMNFTVSTMNKIFSLKVNSEGIIMMTTEIRKLEDIELVMELI